MKKRNVLILVILLAVGFAAVSTTLIINGTLNIAANENDFHVYFSNAIENGVENKNLIKDDTHIAFSQNMSLIGEKYILDYDVTNGSRNYDADLKMNCTESNEYLKVTNEFDEETNLSATETRTGKLTVEVLKAYVGTEEEPTKDIEITCEIVANAVERDSLGEIPPAEKEESPWEITEDNDNNGELSKGDLITLGSESFYVYDIEGDTVKAISQYNLYVGNTCTSNSSSSCTPLEDATGLQDSRAIGYGGSFPLVATTPFLSYSRLQLLENNQIPNDYNISTIKEYVDNYTIKLSSLDKEIKNVRLITKEELEMLGCSKENITCKEAPSFIYSTSYWTSTPNTEEESYDRYVWAVGLSGEFTRYANVDDDFILGVRPVIEISKSLF